MPPRNLIASLAVRHESKKTVSTERRCHNIWRRISWCCPWSMLLRFNMPSKCTCPLYRWFQSLVQWRGTFSLLWFRLATPAVSSLHAATCVFFLVRHLLQCCVNLMERSNHRWTTRPRLSLRLIRLGSFCFNMIQLFAIWLQVPYFKTKLDIRPVVDHTVRVALWSWWKNVYRCRIPHFYLKLPCKIKCSEPW